MTKEVNSKPDLHPVQSSRLTVGGWGQGPEGPGSAGSLEGVGPLPGARWGQATHSPHWLMFMRNRGSWEPSAPMQ